MKNRRKDGRGRKKDLIRVSEGLKEFVRKEKRRIKKERGTEPSEEDVLLGRMDVKEEEIFKEKSDEPDFMNLF